MKNFFRARLSHQLTISQITKLSSQSNFSPGEIEKWYERFIHCYTNGYVTFDEFRIYIKQLNMHQGNEQHQLTKSMIKQLFSSLDIDQDKQLNFEEFFRFNILITQGSIEEKLQFILNHYHRQKDNSYTSQEIVNILTNLFYLLNISQLRNNLSEKMNQILIYINLNNRRNKISWNTFCRTILNHSILLELLLNKDNFEEKLIEYV